MNPIARIFVPLVSASVLSTTAVVNWQPAAWTNNTTYDTPDLSTIIQEIIDRAGWVSGAHMQIIMDNNGSSANAYRTFDSYTTAADAALLTVTYSTPGFMLFL